MTKRRSPASPLATQRAAVSDADIEAIAERAALRAVRAVFLQLGVDMENPLEAQRDFFHLREFGQLMKDVEFRKDLEYIRAWRLRSEAMVGRGFMVVVAMGVTGLMTAMWLGLKSLITTSPAL